MMGRRIALAIGLTALVACSLSLDGYSGGGDADAGHDAAAEGSEDVTPLPPSDAGTDAPVEAGPDPGCNDLGLVVRWTMDDGTGTTVHDCSPNKLDMDFAGDASALSWGKRDGGGALVIDGQGYAEITDSTPFRLPASFTIAAFVRSDERPSGYAGFPWHYGGGGGWELTHAYDGTIYGQVALENDTHLTNGFTSPELGLWHHYAVVFEPGVRFEIFRDGLTAGRIDTFDGGPLPNVGSAGSGLPIRVGPIQDGVSWRGAVDDVRVYTRALSASEIAVLATR